MRKLSHDHVVKLVGQYILPSRELCLLIWPAAVCTLGEFLEDIEHFRLGQADREDILERFKRLGLQDLRTIDPKPNARNQTVTPMTRCPLEYLRSIVGCTAQALAYCHDAKVRHNDIKPSNVLLMPDRVYLADFGVSRDVSDMDHTTTEGQPGTERWRAPELYGGGKKSMQLADMYSLGLVYLLIATVLYNGRIDDLYAVLRYDPYQNRTQQLARREELLGPYITRLSELALADPPHRFRFSGQETIGPKPLLNLIRRMTATTPKSRPEAQQVQDHLSLLGGVHQRYHGSCCRRSEEWIVEEWNKKFDALLSDNARYRKRLEELEGRDQTYERRLENERKKQEQHISSLQKRLEEAEQRCRQLAQDGRRRRPGNSYSPQRKRNSSLLSSNTMLPAPSQPPVWSLTAPSRPPMQSKSQSAHQSLATERARNDIPALQRMTPALRASTEPVTRRSLNMLNGNGTDQRRSSPISRLPLPITPTRAGTPSLRDQSSTDSSLASSVFSRRSVDTIVTPVKQIPTPPGKDDDTVIRVRMPPAARGASIPSLPRGVSWASSNSPPTTPSAPSSPEMLNAHLNDPSDIVRPRPLAADADAKARKRLSFADVLRQHQ